MHSFIENCVYDVSACSSAKLSHLSVLLLLFNASLVALCIRVCPSVSESVRPNNHVNTISERPMREFHPVVVADVFGFVDALIRFWV